MQTLLEILRNNSDSSNNILENANIENDEIDTNDNDLNEYTEESYLLKPKTENSTDFYGHYHSKYTNKNDKNGINFNPACEKLRSIPSQLFKALLRPINTLIYNLTKFSGKYSSQFATVKQLLLILYSLMCIVLFSLYDNEQNLWSQTTISNKATTSVPCSNSFELHPEPHISSQFYKLKLSGPFITLEDVSRTKINSGKYITIYFYSNVTNSVLANWTLMVNLPDRNRPHLFSANRINEKNFKLEKSTREEDLVLIIETNDKTDLGVAWSCNRLGEQFENVILYASILLVFVYILIIFEFVHRAIAAFLGSLGAISVLAIVELERPSLNRILTWVEWETILLMFGMMIIVGIFCETGFFDLLAFRIFHFSGSRIWIMVGSLCLLSALLSAFLDNVTTILLLTPITIRLCEVMSLEARHIIIAEVIFSNIGGVSTAIGDPPNVILTANQIINSKGIEFANFTLHMFIGSILIYCLSFLQFRLLYLDPRHFLKLRETENEEMRKEIGIWTRTYQSVTPITKEEKMVKKLLKEKVNQLESLLVQKIDKSERELEQSLHLKSQEMLDNYRLNDKNLLVKCLLVFSVTLVLFFIHSFIKSIYLSIGWISIFSALVLLVLSLNSASASKQSSKSTVHIDLDGVLHKVEWSTLLFFSGLFIFMKGIEELGLLKFLADYIANIITSVDDKSDRLVFAILILIVFSALISSIIDNIPFTTAMIPIIIQLSDQTDLQLQPLVYALAFGSCLGGNGSLIGASCNLVAAGIAEQHGIRISFKHFFQTGFPIMINSIMVALIYVCVTTVYFDWY